MFYMKKSLLITFLLVPVLGVAQPNICGYVADNKDSVAIEGATVYLYDEYNLPFFEDIRTTTDSNGYYEFRNVEPGRYNINAWTYIEFEADTFAFIIQPGIFNVDTSASAFNTPCFHVNFEFGLHFNRERYEQRKREYHQRNMARLSDPDRRSTLPTGFEYDSASVDWPITLLRGFISKKVSTIDSLYIPMQLAGQIRRKDW